MESREDVVDGVTMHWLEYGEGLPVVLLHGIPTSPDLWRHVIGEGVAGRCLAWEMVGYGSSIPAGRNRDLSIRRQADHLESWLDHLRIERAVLAGHDLGGGVAQIVAVRRPEICAGLFLTNAVGYDSWPLPSMKAMRAAGGLVRHLPDAAFKQIFRSFIARGHDDRARAKESFAVHWAAYEGCGGAQAFLRQIRFLDARDTLAVSNDLPKLRKPARLVWGDADEFQEIEYGERFARDLQAPLHRIHGGRHFTPEDHPEIIARGINRLIEQIAAEPASHL